MMAMSFFFGEELSDFLFSGWTTSSLSLFVLSCMAIAVISAALELIKFCKELLHSKAKKNPLTYAQTEDPLDRSPLVQPLVIPSSEAHIRRRKIRYHIAESCMHVVRVLVAYVIMLAVMSYNAWMAIAVVVGSGFGYFLLGAAMTSLAVPQTQPSSHSCDRQVSREHQGAASHEPESEQAPTFAQAEVYT